ncbi:hypothetical protein B0H13DRAFT_1916535 [Mycena leptocephala]|nr:hypothetical protein B0H13DRAFT_1916535 [Mycena leptocephala]
MTRRRARKTRPFFDALRSQDYAALRLLARMYNPYQDGDGLAYILARVTRQNWSLFNMGLLTWSQLMATADVKVGETSNFDQRLRGYRACEGDYVLIWKLLEALVHEWLFLRGAGIAATRCSCRKCHREFFNGWVAGGFAGVAALIEFLLGALGVIGWTNCACKQDNANVRDSLYSLGFLQTDRASPVKTLPIFSLPLVAYRERLSDEMHTWMATATHNVH